MKFWLIKIMPEEKNLVTLTEQDLIGALALAGVIVCSTMDYERRFDREITPNELDGALCLMARAPKEQRSVYGKWLQKYLNNFAPDHQPFLRECMVKYGFPIS